MIRYRRDGRFIRQSGCEWLTAVAHARPICPCQLTGFESFDGDGRGVVPEALPNLAELAVTQLPDELEAGAVDLPVVPRVVAQPVRGRLLDLREGLRTPERKARRPGVNGKIKKHISQTRPFKC